MIALTMNQSLPERRSRGVAPPSAPQVRTVLGVEIERRANDVELYRKRGLELRRQAMRELGVATMAWLRRAMSR